MSKLLTAENLLSGFPNTLSEDEQQHALASITAVELVELYESNEFLALYARIDELEEPLLDILAYDFKVDWWDESFSLEEKRDIFKNIWRVRRINGTPAAVELFLSSIFEKVTLQEWFEYGGRPFYFRLDVDADPPGTVTPLAYEVIRKRLEKIKSKRSKFEEAIYSRSFNINAFVGAGYLRTYKRIVVPAAVPRDEEGGFN